MIHPMWATFMAAAIPFAQERMGASVGITAEQRIALAAEMAGLCADAACIEYDKRDKAQGGSPYRS